MKENRAFKFGDGVFESIRVINGSVYNFKAHYERLSQGAEVLGLECPNYFSEDFFKTEIAKLVAANNIQAGGRVRLQLFRQGSGAYLPETDHPSFLISAQPLETNLFQLNSEGLLFDIYSDVKKEKNIFSNLKTSNALLYILAMNDAKKNQRDGSFILNQKGNIIEAANSNIFLVSNGVLYTPPLSDGCVGGTMRMNLINVALKQKIKVYESSITPQNLLAADEILLTNAIRGVQWVGGYKTKRYYNQMAKTILGHINEGEANLKLGLQESSKSL